MVLKYLMFLATNFAVNLAVSADTIVTLPNGQINGRVAKTFKNTTFYAFQEIPYAAPPVGNLRFKAPAPVNDWDGVLDTTKNTKICFQLYTMTDTRQREDCLYLNVYTPVVPNSDQMLPVLVFIHGGGFVAGSGVYDDFGPEFFMDTRKIVVVTINYRLGPFGFLSTEDETIPGNFGLKDQTFALKWVQKNIPLFGGDPSQVTIAGQSAGSASVSYQVLSKQSKGLFRAAICESGTVLTSWSYQRYARSIAYQTASFIDSTFTLNNSSRELLQLLQNTSAEAIHYISVYNIPTPSTHINSGYSFAPVVETIEDGFLTQLAYEALESGNINDVSLIIGVNSEESVATASNLDSFKSLMNTIDNDLSFVVNDDFHIEDKDTQTIVGRALRKIYTEGLFKDDLAASIKFLSDCRYSVSIIKGAQLMSKYTDVYFYQFSYDGILGNVNATLLDGADSVAHSEELQYMWRNARNDDIDSFPAADVLTHERLIKLWTNFIVHLNPTYDTSDVLDDLTWPKFSDDNSQYLDIRAKLEVKTNPKGDAFKSFDAVYQQYGVRPFDTY